METTRKCPYCAEPIAAEAVRCPHCRSRLATLDPDAWYRDQPGRRLAGVGVAVSRAFAVPVAVVRVAIILLSFVHLAGPILYAVLWLIIPFRPEEESLAEHALGRAKAVAAQLRPRRPSAMPDEPHS